MASLFGNLIGPRRVEQVKLWSGPAGRYLASAIVLGLFVIEWKAVTAKIPYYRGKYKSDE